MNSPYGSPDDLNAWSWYDLGWENTPLTDEEHVFNYHASSPNSGKFAQILSMWPTSTWPGSTSAAALTAQEHHQYDFEQAEQVWLMSEGDNYQQPQPMPQPGRLDSASMPVPEDGAVTAPLPHPSSSQSITDADPRGYPHSTTVDQLQLLQAFFPSPTLLRREPASPYDDHGQLMQKGKLRFEGDLYTAKWIRGQGASRQGWCGHCDSWHRLKDSAYWYHKHYSHGIICSSGRPLPLPRGLRAGYSGSLEALCGCCQQWISLGKGPKMRAAYWRHAYKCLTKGPVTGHRASPRKRKASNL